MSKHGWTYKKLGEVCETSSGGTPSKNHREYYENGNIPWLRSGEVSQTYIYDTELFITPLGLNNSSAKLFPIDTVVVAMYGATVGQVGILKNAMTTNQAVCGIFPNSYFKPDFLMHFLKCKKSFFLKQAVGGAQSNISQNIIKNLLIPVPPMAEQEAIVAELDEINEAIAALQQQVADLDTLAQATFYDMFGDPVTNPKAWPVKKWEDVLTIINGKNQREIENANGQYPICGSGGIMGYGDSYLCPEYTTIIGRKGNINSPIYMKEKFWNVDTAFGLVANTEVLMPIVLFYFCVFYDFETHNVAVTIPSLRKADLLKINIPIPSLALQQEFTARVEAIEAAKAELNAQIAEMQTLLASRMDYYFD